MVVSNIFLYFLCSPLLGEMISFDWYFSGRLKPPTRRWWNPSLFWASFLRGCHASGWRSWHPWTSSDVVSCVLASVEGNWGTNGSKQASKQIDNLRIYNNQQLATGTTATTTTTTTTTTVRMCSSKFVTDRLKQPHVHMNAAITSQSIAGILLRWAPKYIWYDILV